MKDLSKWFMAMHSKGKPANGFVIIGKAKSFYDEMKITGKCTFYEGWLQNFKESADEGDIHMEYSSD
jgi:hypothetical protein